jgi:hypothetical protein
MAHTMNKRPRTETPIPLSQVLADEYAAVHKTPIPFSDNLSEEDRLREVYRHIHHLPEGRTALCISGGGIRSATFGLGILQGLAQRGLLGKFDFLSTVSGGGYIGSWLTAWAKHHPRGMLGVSQELAARPSHTSSSEPEPVSWLRKHSNYLSPKLGVASADSWTLIGTYLRNLLLNWLVLIPLLLALLAIPRLYVSWARLTPSRWVLYTCLGLGLLCTLVSLTYIHLFRPSLADYRTKWLPREPQYRDAAKAGTPIEKQSWFLWLSLVPILIASILLTLVWAWVSNGTQTSDGLSWLGSAASYGWEYFAGGTAAIHVGSWLIAYGWLGRWKEGFGNSLGEALIIFLSGALGGFFAWVALALETPYGSITASPRLYACLAPASFIGAFLFAATIFVGLASAVTKDEDREWWGRSGSWMLITILGWSGFGVLVVYGPSWLEQFPFTSLASGSTVGAIASWLGFSSRTAPQTGHSSQSKHSLLLSTLPLSIIAPLAVLFVLMAGSALTSWMFDALPSGLRPWDAWNRDPLSLKEPIPFDPWGHREILYYTQSSIVLSFIVIMGAASLLTSYFININKFSLHAMYRNRLIRAYLGASRIERYDNARQPNRFTGFDPDDNFQLTDLTHVAPLNKPFHVINVALNLVHGDNLAWQQRKAQSMTLSPLHCGSFASNLGYRSSQDYGKNQGIGRAITLGTALAISGAAASPNMGYHSSPAVTFLLTLFNIRLGWWLGNPGPAGATTFNQAYPKSSVFRLAQEALGFTDSKNPYVYLSDGGHFENLGLYEMVQRRCHYILISDAGCDQESKFQDLGNAIRKIRIDLGIDIDIDLSPLKPDTQKHVQQHYAVGTIHYAPADSPAATGILIYLKPSLTGNESADVQEYASHHEAFPHEPTSDQFFDESQFESYRRLGEHIALEVFDEGIAGSTTSLHDTFHAFHDHK